jgi:hypothetical protein
MIFIHTTEMIMSQLKIENMFFVSYNCILAFQLLIILFIKRDNKRRLYLGILYVLRLLLILGLF